ncbi:MAG: Smr/MutS family protein [Xanthobacteraceae bacterium]|jgi:DNA-nicking Smr family endonuclease
MSRRRLSDDERTLWRGVARGVKPLRRGGAGLADAPDLPARQSPPQSARQERAAATQPPALAQFERRLRQRVGRGQATIDARLDLHGMTQTQAHAALLRFLTKAQAKGAKLALVVTGKGSGAAGLAASERGVLRRQVPLWLSLPEFRRFVVSFEQAHGSHGGEGALYLRLRRGRG